MTSTSNRLAARFLATRLAARFLEAEWDRVAKPQYLKALDFVAGMIRKFSALGLSVSMDMPNDSLMRRVIQMRKVVQSGYDPLEFKNNPDLLSAAGARIMKQMSNQDAEIMGMLPSEEAKKAFFKSFSNREDSARKRQATAFRRLIRNGVPEASTLSDSELDMKMWSDREMFSQAFAVVNPYVAGQKSKVSGALSAAPGRFQIRDKAEQSTWDKTRKKKYPFYMLGDLLGCRSIVSTVPDLCDASLAAQSKLAILAKDNRYLNLGDGYNAVHYTLQTGDLVVEYQLKTKGNFLEAGLSHDILHSDVKFQARFPQMDLLPSAQKDLVRMVIEVSAQLSARDWAAYLEDPALGTGEGAEGNHLLYETPEGRPMLGSDQGRVLGMLRLAAMGVITLR